MSNARFFNPASLTITVGDTVTWTVEQGSHDTVSGSSGVPSGVWNSGSQFSPLMLVGDSFSHTFNTPGTFPYYCTPHWILGMVGTITVLPGNSPPTVSILSPPEGANFSSPADITIQATAADSDGAVSQVEFFMNESVIAVLSTPPYAVTVTNLGNGNYTFRVAATDDDGATANAAVSLTVTNVPTGTPPRIDAQPASQTILSGSNVTFTVAAIGSAPLSWQWFFNSAALPGATESLLTLSNVTLAHSGSYFVVVSNAFGLATSAPAILTVVTPLFPARNDFNRDGHSDFLWQHTDGHIRLWLMDGVTNIGTLFLRASSSMPPGSRIVGTHDFNRDRNEDILWQHPGGSLEIWLMNRTNLLRSVSISNAPPLAPSWRVAALGDFNHDTRADVLFRHRDGYLLVWFLRGKNFLSQTLLLNGDPVPLDWRIVGAADMNGDGHTDILWQSSDSSIVVWFMNDITPITGPLLGHLPRPNGRIVGLNDLNQDGQLDFIWRHADNHLFVWWMNQTNRIGSFPINYGQPVPSSWKLVAPKN